MLEGVLRGCAIRPESYVIQGVFYVIGALLERLSSLINQVARDNPMNDAQHLTHRMRMGSEQAPYRIGKTDDPLTQWHVGKYFIRDKGRCLGHAMAATAGQEFRCLQENATLLAFFLFCNTLR